MKYNLTPDQYHQAYKQMFLIRRFEDKCAQLYGMGLIRGFCHLCSGQEAIISAVHLAKQEGDKTVTSYRDHGHLIASGMDVKYALAELLGKEEGCSKGRGGSMHMFNLKGNFFGGHGIVGAQIPIGTGIAFAEKYNETSNICYTFLGDGAANQGQFFESMNIAALWELPVLYIIENNEYGMGTSVKRATSEPDLYKRGESLCIIGQQVNGMNLQEVYSAIMEATEYVRSNSSPMILEMKTYRYKGHSMSDPAQYRTKEEVEKYKNKDPILSVRDIVLQDIEEEKLKETEQSIRIKIQEAVEFAKNAPVANIDNLCKGVYV